MKLVVAGLVVLLLGLQYRLWFGEGSVQELWRVREEARATRAEVLRLRARNQALRAEVADLKSGLDAIEERARTDLGMIGADETFYRFVRAPGTARGKDGDATRDAGGRTDGGARNDVGVGTDDGAGRGVVGAGDGSGAGAVGGTGDGAEIGSGDGVDVGREDDAAVSDATFAPDAASGRIRRVD